MTGEEKAIIFCVPEDCLFDTVDKSMAIFPNDAVSFMVSEHDYLLLETKCKQQREAIEVIFNMVMVKIVPYQNLLTNIKWASQMGTD